MLPRLSKRLFVDLALWMLLFGLLMGITFPYFLLSLGFDKAQVLTLEFYSATMIAGIMVALINYAMVRAIIGVRLSMQTERMRSVARAVQSQSFHEGEQLDAGALKLVVDSEDDMGEAARSFNELVDSLGRSYRVGQEVNRFTKMMAGHLDVQGLTEQALASLQLNTGSMAGAVFVLRDQRLLLMASQGIATAADLAENEILNDVLRKGEIRRINYPEAITVEGVLTRFRPREVMLVPVAFKGVAEALVVLASQYEYPADTEQVLELYRAGMGLALRNAMSHERLQRLAVLDPLTNVYNRRFGMGRLAEEYSRVVRDSAAMSVLMLDIDDFKVLNDTYGHIVGDKVIINVVKAIKGNLREGDVLVRYGGEEFLLILPGASLEDGKAIGERIRRTIMDSVLEEGGQRINQTVSLGISAYPDQRLDREEDLIRLADEALYLAKQSGKNRLMWG